MWIIDGLSSEDRTIRGHSFPFRNAGASLKPGRSPADMAVAVRNSSRRKSSGMMRNKCGIFEHVMSESEREKRKEKNRIGVIIFKRRRAEEWIGAVYFIFSGRELEKRKRVVLVF